MRTDFIIILSFIKLLISICFARITKQGKKFIVNKQNLRLNTIIKESRILFTILYIVSFATQYYKFSFFIILESTFHP